jgi:2,4-dienoyl-CoA reductase-like NADH-dependent reductase (Old Yellow Enzyme family)
MHPLFRPIELRGLGLANRIVVSPMCQYSADRGCATDWHLIHWGQMLLSGAGMMTVEATAVTREGRITEGCLGLFDDATEEALGTNLGRARRQTPPMPVTLQLAHAGRKASSARPWEGGSLVPLQEGGWTPVAPSAIAHAPDEPAPKALDAAGLRAVADAFVAAAKRADRIGVDAIELHLAHGYLLHEFLSPLANRRTDGYGGSYANRIRFPLEVFDAVRAAWPSGRPLGARISATDWVDGGWTLPESVELARELKARGCDWIDVSAGGISPAQRIPAPTPGVHVPYAREIRRVTGIATMVVGLITEPEHANAIIAAGDADMVALARAMLRDPRWPWRAAAALGGTVSAAPQYARSLTREMSGIFGGLKIGQR